MSSENRRHPFRDSHQDIETSHHIPDTPQTRAPAYRLAFDDNDFLCRAFEHSAPDTNQFYIRR